MDDGGVDGDGEMRDKRDALDVRRSYKSHFPFCSPCLTMTTLRLCGKLIVQFTNLSKIGCSNAFPDFPFRNLAEGTEM